MTSCMVKIVNQENKEKQEEKILQAARKLFEEEGYDNASVNKIIKHMKIAKGTFYHYFPSKEDLLDKMIKVMIKEAMRPIKKEIEREGFSAVEKFNNVVNQIYTYKLRHRKLQKMFLKFFYSEKNSSLIQKIINRSKVAVVPEFAKILEQGKKDGSFKIKNSEIVATIIMDLMMSFFESILPYLKKSKLEKKDVNTILDLSDVYRDAIEKVMGAKEGTVDVLNKKVLKQLLFIE